ncbi:prostatic acid phosphatase-like [Homalodisca vitripennis]|nr:prostatic acid phosphatase-like [Homalodisca vitripennis]
MEESRSFLIQFSKRPKRNVFTTVVILGGIIIAFLFAYTAFGEDHEKISLKQANIIFRHGDKTPTSAYSNDPFKEAIFWPEGWGQLTKKGKKQMYQLGELLRVRYGQFVGPYSLQTVRVDSSDHDRCLQSAGALLAGFFPPQGDQIWNSKLLWQPVPIHALPLNSDKLITMRAPCPLYNEEQRSSDKVLAASYDDKDLYKYLSEHSGQNVSTLLDVETLFNILEIEKESGKDLPSWTISVFPEKMKDIAALVLASFTNTPLMKRLRGGPLVKEIKTNMESYVSGASKRKLSLYSAHDTTLVNFRRALGFNDFTFKPQLGSAIIVELHVIDNIPQVEFYYLDSYAATATERWEVPGCPTPCTLDKFSETMASVVPLDWDAECQSQEHSSSS